MHCINLESQYGIPTASVQVQPFEKVVKATAFAKGTPQQRFVFLPMPVMGKSPAELRAYLEGEDPVTRIPVMEEVIDALTKPLQPEETKKVDFDRSTPRMVDPDTESNLQNLFLHNV